MNTPMEEVEHDFVELKDDVHSTIIKHDKLNIEEELTLELSESVDEPTHFSTIVMEEPTDILHDYMYFSTDAGIMVQAPTERYTTLRPLTKFEAYTILLHIILNRWSFLKLIFSRGHIEDNVYLKCEA
ncbi:hypothetical protein J1N35_022203 [Gossypium stocksii]|uniref:Uncharacterized protein n=1 Tax=Gossypium stocksii TaxID=47602 RepID=A0A9D3VH48_9ROSI|nr:hypothetical protein J1N35_022203 [Gossypium stocksii]